MVSQLRFTILVPRSSSTFRIALSRGNPLTWMETLSGLDSAGWVDILRIRA